jgi:hypothetical protein
MPLSKRFAASRSLFVILPFVICVSIGLVAGFHGGLHNEATTAYYSSDWSRAIARHNELRLYGAFVLLTTLSVSALVTLALFVGGIFSVRPKPRGLRISKVYSRSHDAVIRVYAPEGSRTVGVWEAGTAVGKRIVSRCPETTDLSGRF